MYPTPNNKTKMWEPKGLVGLRTANKAPAGFALSQSFFLAKVLVYKSKVSQQILIPYLITFSS